MRVAVIGVCVLLMVFVKDNGLQRKEEQVDARLEEGEGVGVPNEKSDLVVEPMNAVKA